MFSFFFLFNIVHSTFRLQAVDHLRSGGWRRTVDAVSSQRRQVQLLSQLLLQIVLSCGFRCWLLHLRWPRVELILEVDLRGADQRSTHEDRECGETNGVVLLPFVRSARVIRKCGGMIKCDSNEKHR